MTTDPAAAAPQPALPSWDQIMGAISERFWQLAPEEFAAAGHRDLKFLTNWQDLMAAVRDGIEASYAAPEPDGMSDVYVTPAIEQINELDRGLGERGIPIDCSGPVGAALGEIDFYRERYAAVQRVLDEFIGPKGEDGRGEGIAADVRLLGEQRDQARAEAKEWRDDLARLSRSRAQSF